MAIEKPEVILSSEGQTPITQTLISVHNDPIYIGLMILLEEDYARCSHLQYQQEILPLAVKFMNGSFTEAVYKTTKKNIKSNSDGDFIGEACVSHI